MNRQTIWYKGIKIFARKRNGFPYYYAILSEKGGGIIRYVDRDEEGGIDTPNEAIDIAKYEIDQGYHLFDKEATP